MELYSYSAVCLPQPLSGSLSSRVCTLTSYSSWSIFLLGFPRFLTKEYLVTEYCSVLANSIATYYSGKVITHEGYHIKKGTAELSINFSVNSVRGLKIRDHFFTFAKNAI